MIIASLTTFYIYQNRFLLRQAFLPSAVAEPVEGLTTGLLILLLPVLLTLPLRFGWKWWVGMEPEHEHYREKVRRVLDSGIPIKRYRTCLLYTSDAADE